MHAKLKDSFNPNSPLIESQLTFQFQSQSATHYYAATIHSYLMLTPQLHTNFSILYHTNVCALTLFSLITEINSTADASKLNPIRRLTKSTAACENNDKHDRQYSWPHHEAPHHQRRKLCVFLTTCMSSKKKSKNHKKKTGNY